MRIFVSYARADQDLVNRLVSDLHELRLETYYDRQLVGGQLWWSELLRQIEGSTIFLPCLFDNYRDSEACRREAKYAADLGIPFLPLVLTGDAPSPAGFPPALADANWAHWDPAERTSLGHLATSLHRIGPVVPPAIAPEPPPAPVDYRLHEIDESVRGTDPLPPERQGALLSELRGLLDGPHADIAGDLLARLRLRSDLVPEVRREVDVVLGIVAPEPPDGADGGDPPADGRTGWLGNRWAVVLTVFAVLAVVIGSTLLATQLGDPGEDPPADDSSLETSDGPSPSADKPTFTPAPMPDLPLTVNTCGADQSSQNAFMVAGLVPQSGNLDFLGPPATAGIGLAVSDIQASGGVGDLRACHSFYDSSDLHHPGKSRAAAEEIVADGASVVVGPMSSSVTHNVIDTFSDSGLVEVSPGASARDLSGFSPYLFRTSAIEPVQGDALARLILRDGHRRVGFLVFDDIYGTALRGGIQRKIVAEGAECVYGCSGDDVEFPTGETHFADEVSSLLAADPDAVAVIAFDETNAAVTELAGQGFDLPNMYFSDGNMTPYNDLGAISLEGVQGTIPGVQPAQDFQDRLKAWASLADQGSLLEVSLAAEAYDATILSALAAVAGDGTGPDSIRLNLLPVSGAAQGETCESFASCVELLEEGAKIRYRGPSRIGPLDEEHDPVSAFLGVYAYDKDNIHRYVEQIEGSKY